LSYFGNNFHWVEHFPKAIPSDAQDLRFYFLPKILQGSGHLQLQMKLPPQEIRCLQAELRKTAKHRYLPSGLDNSPKQATTPDGTGIAFDYRYYQGQPHFTEWEVFPEYFEVYVLEDSRRNLTQSGMLRPIYYGIAIHPQASEVVYWLEYT
jgi:hypothetical protein